MKLSRALEIFEYNSIKEIDLQDMKIKYRKLMKANHPDIGGSEQAAKEINRANEILTNAAKKIEQLLSNTDRTKPLVIIDFLSLLRLYNGEALAVEHRQTTPPFLSTTMTITRSTVYNFNIIVWLKADLTIHNQTINYESLRKFSDNNEYEIDCMYQYHDMSSILPVKFAVYNKSISTEIGGGFYRLVFNFDGIKVVLKVERKLLVKSSNT